MQIRLGTRIFKKYIVRHGFAFLALSLVCLLLYPVGSYADDQVVKTPHRGAIASQNSLAFQVVDSFPKGFSALYASSLMNGIVKFCKSLDEIGCETNLNADTVLPLCNSETSQNCIESLHVIDESFRRKLNFLRYIKIKEDYVYSSSLPQGLPEPGQISLWREDNPSGDRFFSLNASLASKSIGTGKELVFKPIDLSIEISEYVERRENISLAIGPMQGPIAAGWNPPASLKGIQCAWHEIGICGVKQKMNLSEKLEVTLRVSNSVSGWVYGRLRDQVVSIEPFSDDQSRITISGSPVEVPGILAELDYSKDAKLVEKYAELARWTMPQQLFLPMTQVILSDSGQSAILDAFSEVLQDKAQFSYTAWSIYTKPIQNVRATSLGQYKLQECIGKESGLQGFVTSNAPIYESLPPTFDGESLNYKVSGAHLKSDGSIFEGSYNLSIRSSLARCIYKFTAAPISATISVVNSEGENKVSTTTFNETKSGWINFTAAGFTFSSPTIKVRITQEKEILPTPSPSPTMKTPVLKTIKCQKKKTVKKVSGTSPACPAGYKKIS